MSKSLILKLQNLVDKNIIIFLKDCKKLEKGAKICGVCAVFC